MSFFHKKMSQNVWATIMPFGPVTLIFYWPKKKISGQPSFQALLAVFIKPIFPPRNTGSTILFGVLVNHTCNFEQTFFFHRIQREIHM